MAEELSAFDSVATSCCRHGNRLRHLPFLGFVRRLRFGDQDRLLARSKLLRHQHQRDFARTLLFAAQDGSVAQCIAGFLFCAWSRQPNSNVTHVDRKTIVVPVYLMTYAAEAIFNHAAKAIEKAQ